MRNGSVKWKNFFWFFIGNRLKLILPFRIYGFWKTGLRVVSRSSKITIEAFPRSGNTFLFSLVSQQIDAQFIAHHLHTISHLKEALRLNVPVIFILRNPNDAIPSYMIREGISVNRALQHYEQLYNFVIKNHENIHLIDFQKVVSRSDELNLLLEKTLGHSTEHWNSIRMSDVFDQVEEMDAKNSGGAVSEMRVARPSKQRDEQKRKVLELLTSSNADALNRCIGLYKQLTSDVETL